MKTKKKNEVTEKSVGFSIAILKYYDTLVENKQILLAKQLLQSATSIGVSLLHAQYADNNVEYLDKLQAARKSASATSYWLLLCERNEDCPFQSELTEKLHEISLLLMRMIDATKETST